MQRAWLVVAVTCAAPRAIRAYTLATARPRPPRAFAAPVMDLSVPGVADSSEVCLVLPMEDFEGEAPTPLVGEIMLQELEDDTDTRTQLFLNADGTVTHGATDGPPPLGTCGLWQCGATSFQMTLQRTFTTSLSLNDPSLDDPLNYCVTRIYLGTVDPTSSGVKMIEGRIALVRGDGDYGGVTGESSATTVGTPGTDRLNHADAPIGYFVIDGNTEAEMEDEADE